MIFFKATIHKDQLSADFEWPGKINLTEAELGKFIKELSKIKRELLTMPGSGYPSDAKVDLRRLQ